MITTKSKYIIHIITFLVALSVVISTYFILLSNNIIFIGNLMPIKRNCNNNSKNCKVEDYLNSGKIVMFGTSEIYAKEYVRQKYSSINFFARRNKPIIYNAMNGYQALGRLAQILAYYNKNIQNNARIIIFLSPSDFYPVDRSQKKSIFVKFIKDYELKRILAISNNSINSPYKNYIIKAMKVRYGVKIPSFLHHIPSPIEPWSIQQYQYNFQAMNSLDSSKYFTDATNIEKNLDTNNTLGMHNREFNSYHKSMPYHRIIDGMKNNDVFKKKEYLDFIMLVQFLHSLKVKPLFLMQDVGWYSDNHRELLLPLLKNIKQVLKDNNMGYFDMWTYNKSDIVFGKTSDGYHTANVGWVMINKKIIDYFSKKGN